MDIQEKRSQVLNKLEAEEETESSLIWLYDNLLDLGVENCFPPAVRERVRVNMKILADESRKHRLMLDKIKANYQF